MLVVFDKIFVFIVNVDTVLFCFYTIFYYLLQAVNIADSDMEM